MTDVLHIDDLYQHDPNDFPTLRNFLAERLVEITTAARFEEADIVYRHRGFPHVVIMDILDESATGAITAVGVDAAQNLEDTHVSSRVAPCIIYYTGVPADDPEILKIRDRNPYTPIVFKSEDPLEDAQEIWSHFPLSMKDRIASPDEQEEI